MRIGFVLQDPARAPTGLDSYTWGLWHALRSLGSECELVPITLPRRVAGRAYLRALWEQVYLPLWAERQKVDLLHVPAGSAPVALRKPCVLTLHDLGEEATPSYRTPLGPRLYFGRVVPWSARFATAILSDSAATKRDAIARLGIPEDRITVVPLAPGPWCRGRAPEAVARVRRKHGLGARYFLQVGARIPRKNLSGALVGFGRLLCRHPDLSIEYVVVGGPGFGERTLPSEAEDAVRQGRVRFLGHVPAEDLAALYSGALAVVQPSFYEGFGLPLVEAFACGTPAVVSNVAALPEVAGNAALYVDPRDTDSIAHAMERYATIPELRADMVERAKERSAHFSWQKTAEETLAVYRRALGERRRSTTRVPGRPVAASSRPAAPKMLFVRLDSLGDVILTTPCFEAARRRYPGARVDVVVRPETAALVEASAHVDGVFALDAPWHGRWRACAPVEVWRMLRRLRRERYDYVVTLRRDLDDAVFARLCGGRRTVGFDAGRTRPFLSDRVRFRSDRHVVENHLQLMTLLGCEVDSLRPSIDCTSGNPERIDALLAGAARAPMLVGLAPFGSSGTKTWEASRTAAFIEGLATTLRVRIVLLGGPGDRCRADAVAGRTASPVIDLVGRTDLPALCDVLRRCRLFVGVDSGPMHLAAALGIPMVALFGEEDPVLWGPHGGVRHRILRALDGHGRFSVQAVPVGMVLAAVKELLEASEEADRLARAEAAA